jgi:hypothetical protein
MWVFTRPRGGQDYYLLEKKNTAGGEFCPIHRFDGKYKISMSRIAIASARSKSGRGGWGIHFYRCAETLLEVIS